MPYHEVYIPRPGLDALPPVNASLVFFHFSFFCPSPYILVPLLLCPTYSGLLSLEGITNQYKR